MKFESQIGAKTVYQPLSFYLINFYLIGSQQTGRCAIDDNLTKLKHIK